MIHDAIYLIIGAFVGWLTPEPQWAKTLVTKIKTKVAGFFHLT